MKKENLNENEQLNQCHPELDSGSPKDRLRRRLSAQDLNRDAECPQHDGIGCEGGRSMVEMLGVLAIIGVLTVAGVAGFRYAMNKHYANQTVERLMRRAVTVSAQRLLGQNVSLNEFDENDGEYKITLLDPTNNESFTMQVEDIPQEVCQQILGMDWKLAKMNPDNCSEETINFMFLNELTNCTDCQPESFPCEDYGTECGKCSVVKGFFPNEGNACTDESTPHCFEGHCSKCNPDQVFGENNQCWSCTGFGQYITSVPEKEAHKCLAKAYYANNKMIRCHYNAPSENSDTQSCKECEERCLDTRANNTCRLLDSAHIRNSDGTCACVTNYFFSRDWNQCINCQTGYATDTATSVSEAHKCLTKDFYANGRMYYCDSRSAQPSNADEESCKACSERCFDATNNNNTCRLLSSGYGRDAQGNCTN